MRSNWKAELKKAARSVIITINNDTIHTFVRASYKMEQGMWRCFPPETIEPNTKVEFGTESDGFMTGTKGTVQYMLPPQHTQQHTPLLFTFEWNIPFFGETSFAFTSARGYTIEPRMTKGAGSTTKAYQSDLSFLIRHVRPQNQGQNPKEEASTANVNHAAPLNPVTRVNDVDWRKQVLSSARGLFVKIHNDTSHTLRIRDYELLHGVWHCLPPEKIMPSQRVEFGTGSFGFCTGTEGSVFYEVTGIKGDLRFWFDNPFVGDNKFLHHCPNGSFLVEKQVAKGNIATVTFLIKETGPKIVPGHSVHIKVLSFNTMLLPPLLTATSPGERAVSIAQAIVNVKEQYDILCLQEVFYDFARDHLTKALSPHYPYMVTKSGQDIYIVGQDSGLFFASKFPILWKEFHQFTNGVGSDVFASKGVLGVKLDIGSVIKDAVLYVFSAHLQADPDDSLGWQMVPKKHERARVVRSLQLEFIRNFIHNTLSKNEPKLSKVAVLLCGDLNVVAEIENAPVHDHRESKVQVPQAPTSPDISDAHQEGSLASLAQRLDANSKELTFAHQITPLLDSHHAHPHSSRNHHYTPHSCMGTLRSLSKLHRLKSLILTEMVVWVLFLDAYNMWLSELSTTSAVPEALFRRLILDAFSRLFEPANSKFWTVEIKPRLEAEFPHSLTEHERGASYDLRTQLLTFQNLRSLQNVSGVKLKGSAEIQLLQSAQKLNVELRVQDDDIDEISLPSLLKMDGREAKPETIELNRPSGADLLSLESDGLEPTEEYQRMMAMLGYPRDLYREHNQGQPGYTLHHGQNNLVVDKVNTRIDYVLLYDRDPAPDPVLGPMGLSSSAGRLISLKCAGSAVVPFGSSPGTRLSDHFAVEAMLITTSSPSHNPI